MYEKANNTVEFSCIKENIDEIREAIESLGQGSHIVIIDLNEQIKGIKE